MDIKKILIALIITFAVVGLTGVASASLFDDIMASYAHTTIDFTSVFGDVTTSISEEYYGTHTSSFSESGITTETEVIVEPVTGAVGTVEPSSSIFDYYQLASTPTLSISDYYTLP